MNKEIQKKAQELQVLEQHLQSFLAQKQMIQLELNEALNALEEVKKTKDEIYKILSGVMIKANKQSIIEELEEKKKLSELKINSIEKQEAMIEKKASELRSEINSLMQETMREEKKAKHEK